MKLETLARYYAEHHADGKRRDFVFIGEERASLFQRWIGQGKRVLDIGCRDGALTAFYVSGNTVIGVDVDRGALSRCAERLKVETCWVDINDGLPFADHEFEVVVAGEVLEHTVLPEVVVREVHRVLVPGGLFVGSVPNAFRLKNRLLFLCGVEFEGDRTHLRRFSPRSLGLLLASHFTSVEIVPLGGRYLRFAPQLFGLDLAWRCLRPC